MGRMGAYAAIGFAPEVTWGTGVAPAHWLMANESLNDERPDLPIDTPTGSRFLPRGDQGRPTYSGSLSNIVLQEETLGWLLRGVLGVPTTTADTPGTGFHTHVFTPQSDPFASGVALPPYTIQTQVGDRIKQFLGCQFGSMTINAPVDNRVTADVEVMAKGVDYAQSAGTPSLETGTRVQFRHAAHTRASTAFPHFEVIGVTINNNVEMPPTQDGTVQARASLLGTLGVEVSTTVPHDAPNIFDDYNTDTPAAYEFKWVMTAGEFELTVSVPALRWTSYPDPISGRGRLTATPSGMGELDSVSGNNIEVTLINSVASYA